MDEKLLKPVPSLFLVSLGTHDPFKLVQTCLGAVLVVYGQRALDETLGLWKIAGWLAMLVTGMAIVWATRVGLATIALQAPSLELDVVYGAVWQFARYPITIYEQPLRFALSWMIL